MNGLFALALIGQAQSCIVQQTYQPQYQVQYATQVYADALTWVAVEQVQMPQQYYGGLVAHEQRQAERQVQVQQQQLSVDAKIDRLSTAIEALQLKLEARANEQSQPLLPRKPQVGDAPANPSSSSIPSEAVPPPPTISQASLPGRQHVGLATLSRACAGCHMGEAKAGGGIALFAQDGSFTARERDDLERIEAAITSGRMPKQAKQPISLKEYIAIRDYLNEQASGLALNTNPRKSAR